MSTSDPSGPPSFGQGPPGLRPGAPAPPSAGPGSPPPAGWLPVGPGEAPAAPAGAKRSGRNPVGTIAGIVLIVAGVAGAAALFVVGNQQLGDGVSKLARGPANCVTDLRVESDGTYYFYLETKGELGDVGGDCGEEGDTYEADEGERARIRLADRDDEPVRLHRASGASYDTDGYRGELVQTADLEAGRYALTVTSDGNVVVAVGQRNVDDLKPSPLWPVLCAAVGIVLGVLLLVLSKGRKPSLATPAGQPLPSAPGGPPAPPFSGASGWTSPAAAPPRPMGDPPPAPSGDHDPFMPPPPPNP